MFKSFVWFMLLIFSACTYFKGPSKEVKTFVQSYEDQWGPEDPRYGEIYERYLGSVERIYKKHERKAAFRSYLDSLNSNSLTLSDQKKAMPELFKKETGQTVNKSTKQPYMRFKKREMNELADKLYSAREMKIKEEAGKEIFEELKKNYGKFVQREGAEDLSFPL